MDKYDGIINKPEMEEVLYHAGFHKYIDKYLGKNGKWIYKYAGQAKNAVSDVVNKAKTMLPGLQKQATGAVSTAKKQASSIMSTGRKTTSTAKKQAQKRINAMLPILSKKFNSAKKKARSQAAGVKLVARDKTKKLKKQADGTIKNVQNKVKDVYYREKSKAGARNVKAVRKALKIKDPTIITEGAKIKRYPMVTKYSINKAYYGNSGKSDSRSSQRGSRVNEGIAAGRKRAARKRKK